MRLHLRPVLDRPRAAILRRAGRPVRRPVLRRRGAGLILLLVALELWFFPGLPSAAAGQLILLGLCFFLAICGLTCLCARAARSTRSMCEKSGQDRAVAQM